MALFKQNPYLSVNAGEFHFSFYYKEGSIKDTYLEITCDSGVFALKIGGNTYTYGYLLAAAKMGLIEQLRGYGATIYAPAMAITNDQKLCDDCQQAIIAWQERKMREGAENASKITAEQELADDLCMRDVIERGKPKNRQQRRKMERESRKEMRKVIREDEIFAKKPKQ